MNKKSLGKTLWFVWLPLIISGGLLSILPIVFSNAGLFLNLGVLLLVGVITSAGLFLMSGGRSDEMTELTDHLKHLSQGNIQFEKQNGPVEADKNSEAVNHLHLLEAYLQNLDEVLHRVGQGDVSLNVELRSEQDEMNRSISSMLVFLRQVLSVVAENVKTVDEAINQMTVIFDNIKTASVQITGSMENVGEGITVQTQSIEQTTQSSNQMNHVIEGVAKGAQEQAQAITEASTLANQISTSLAEVSRYVRQASQDSESSTKTAHAGQKVVEDTVQGMQAIRERIIFSAEQTQEMGQRTEKIGLIVETIEDIASQTNLLALNAAIEAARAGEYGRGFAVVADEVRKLAERSSHSVKEVDSLVKEIQQTVVKNVNAVNQVVEEVNKGVTLSKEADKALGMIIQSAQAVNLGTSQADQAVDQMVSVVDKLDHSFESISAVVEENTAATEEMAASSSEVENSIKQIGMISEGNSVAVQEIIYSTQDLQTMTQQLTDLSQSLIGMTTHLRQAISKFSIEFNAGKFTLGSALALRIKFVNEKYGEAAFKKVLNRLDPQTKSALSGKIDPGITYPRELSTNLSQAICDELGNGKDDILFDIAAYQAREDIKTEFKQFFTAGDPSSIVKRMDLITRHYWGEILVIIERLGPKSYHVKLGHAPLISDKLCHFNWPGWVTGAVTAAGGIKPQVKKQACSHQGADYCEYEISWQ